MRIKLLFIFSVLSISLSVAQEVKKVEESKFYSKIFAGYAFRASGGISQQTSDNPDNSTAVYTLVPLSYGKGVNLGYALGCMVNKNMGFEMGLSYFWGGRNTTENFYRKPNAANPYTIEQTAKYRVNLFRVNPSLVLTADWKKIIPYMRVGYMLGWGKGYGDIQENVKYTNSTDVTLGQYNWEHKGGMARGFTSALGINFKSNDEVASFFVELTHINMKGTFEKSELVEANVNSQSIYSYMSVSQKEIVYVDRLDTSNPQLSSQPKEELRGLAPFGSFGFNIGLMLKMYSGTGAKQAKEVKEKKKILHSDPIY